MLQGHTREQQGTNCRRGRPDGEGIWGNFAQTRGSARRGHRHRRQRPAGSCQSRAGARWEEGVGLMLRELSMHGGLRAPPLQPRASSVLRLSCRVPGLVPAASALVRGIYSRGPRHLRRPTAQRCCGGVLLPPAWSRSPTASPTPAPQTKHPDTAPLQLGEGLIVGPQPRRGCAGGPWGHKATPQ